LGASFDAIINDLDEAGKKAAEHVLNNLPEKKLSATALLIPKLPEVSPADTSAIEKLRDSGLLVMPIAQNTNALYVNASYKGKSFNDESIKLLKPIAPQLLWLNVARTAITDNATESLTNFSLLERLHAENTQLTDAATPNISKLTNLKYLNLYGTDISDASIENLRKLKKLEKVFLWQTKVTSTGAESLRKNFVDQKIYANLTKEKSSLTSEIDKITKRYDLEIENLNAVMQKNSDITEDTSPINDKCPVSNKPIDENRFSHFEGRMVGLCCDNCKSKFVKDPSSYRSKIANFKPSKTFETSLAAVKSKEASKEEALEKVGEKLREISSKLNAMGPEINLGWSIAQTQK
jgi:Leucine-rich repeat (LRR) protein